MSREPQRICPSCGNEISRAMEFCPVCMLRNGLAGGVESGGVLCFRGSHQADAWTVSATI